MKKAAFDRKQHVYKNSAFEELIKDALRFFSGTPVHEMPPPESFIGAGVYALYYTGKNPLYKKYAELNRLAYAAPIYIGKAVPKGWRQARSSNTEAATTKELNLRLKQHARNIDDVIDLTKGEFSCRFVIFEFASSDMINTVEAALIKLYRPLWNSALDGFGNHDPGRGRYEQAKSDWDVIHAGRIFADKCKGKSRDKRDILENIERHFGIIYEIT